LPFQSCSLSAENEFTNRNIGKLGAFAEPDIIEVSIARQLS